MRPLRHDPVNPATLSSSKGDDMNLKTNLILILFALLVLTAQAALGATDAQLKLAKGARGDLCLTCHESFKDTMKKPHIHTPLKKGDCTGCHNPHAADHGKLMAAEPNRICSKCHDGLIPDGSKSVHQVVAEGQCALCHDPHAADNRNNLVRRGSALCFECHTDLGKAISQNKVKHVPVEKDCLTCHNPHASGSGPALLKEKAPKLCLKCHDPNKGTFKSQHLNYPVQNANCSSCHNPHGSNSKSILYDNVHEPLKKRMCKQCHEDPSSATPFATLKPGYELCQGCHYEMLNDTFNKDRLHWPLADQKGCINCHAPHASSEANLMAGPMLNVCGSCHADTIARQERSLTKHQPIADGECASCHSVHSSNNRFILNEPNTVDLCGQCHDWQTHSTHPIGSEVIDPRNRNLTLDCLSCHRTHGTQYKHFIYYETINDLCIQCHTKYRR